MPKLKQGDRVFIPITVHKHQHSVSGDTGIVLQVAPDSVLVCTSDSIQKYTLDKVEFMQKGTYLLAYEVLPVIYNGMEVEQLRLNKWGDVDNISPDGVYRIKRRMYPKGWYFYKGDNLEEAILYVDSKGNWSTPNGAFTPDLSKIGKKFL